MYSREYTIAIKKEFWTALNVYMQPVPSVSGLPVNWLNYKTGIKDLFIRTDAFKQQAIAGFFLSHKNDAVRLKFFNQFVLLKAYFQEIAGKNFLWEENFMNEYDGRTISRIITFTQGSFYDKNNWPELISFFKENLINLDAFWNDVKPVFESLNSEIK